MRTAPGLSSLFAIAIAIAAGCADPPAAADLSVEAAGPAAVGTARWTAFDDARARAVTVQAFYPAVDAAAAEASAGFPIEDTEDEPRRTQYADLLAAAPAACPTRTVHAARDAAPASGRHPVVLFSHCHECTRLSALSIAVRLASHGFVVIAIEHTGNTLWNKLAGDGLALSQDTLQLRAADVRVVLDQLAAGGPELPAGLADAVDLDHVGMFGHSFGAVTTGLVAQEDARIDAALALAAPMENPLLPGVTLADITVPLLFEVSVEDNSITEFGNQFIRDNFTAATGPAWKLEVADAGHWSSSDLVGLHADFAPGCGDGARQTDGTPFSYLDPAIGRDLSAAYVTAFFRATLEGDAGAASYLTSARPTGVVTADHHE